MRDGERVYIGGAVSSFDPSSLVLPQDRQRERALISKLSAAAIPAEQACGGASRSSQAHLGGCQPQPQARLRG